MREAASFIDTNGEDILEVNFYPHNRRVMLTPVIKRPESCPEKEIELSHEEARVLARTILSMVGEE